MAFFRYGLAAADALLLVDSVLNDTCFPFLLIATFTDDLHALIGHRSFIGLDWRNPRFGASQGGGGHV